MIQESAEKILASRDMPQYFGIAFTASEVLNPIFDHPKCVGVHSNMT